MTDKLYDGFRGTIHLGDIPLEVFLVPDLDGYRLSKAQILNAIEVSDNWLSRLRKESVKALQWLQAKGFSGYEIKIKIVNEAKGRDAIGITVDDATKIWGWFARQGNDLAMDLLEASAAEAIERRADKVFNRTRTEEEINRQMMMRLFGKRTRRQLTDAIKDWILRQEDPKSNRCKFAYSNASDVLNLLLFGAKAKKLCYQFKCDKSHLRDFFNFEQLRDIENLEDIAVRLIDKQGADPVAAVKEAHNRIWN